MLEFLSGVAGGLLASGAGALVAMGLVLGLRAIGRSHAPAPGRPMMRRPARD